MNIRNTLIALLVMGSLTAISAEAAEPATATPAAAVVSAKPVVKPGHTALRHHKARIHHGRKAGKTLAVHKAGVSKNDVMGKKVVISKKAGQSTKPEAVKS